jgi:cytochrome c-type biogenesis protein CcmH/NrfG
MDLASKRPSDAAARLEAQLAKQPTNPQLLVLAGRTYAAIGDLSKSEAALRRAIDIDPSSMEAYHVLGQIFVRQKKLDEALKAYNDRLAQRPNDIGAQTMVGMLQITQGKETEARATFEKVLSIDARAPVASNNLAYLDAEAGLNLDVALNRAQVARAALPDEPDVSDTLGWVYVKRGLPALAVTPLEEAIGKNPNNPIYYYHLGMAHVGAGDRDRARASLQRALKLSTSFPGAADAQRALDGLGR